MEKLFYYTGAVFYALLGICIASAILILLWNSFKTTAIWNWTSIQLATIRYANKDKFECTQYCLDTLKSRLDYNKKNNKRKYEQKFLEKLISKAAVTKEQENVFG